MQYAVIIHCLIGIARGSKVGIIASFGLLAARATQKDELSVVKVDDRAYRLWHNVPTHRVDQYGSVGGAVGLVYGMVQRRNVWLSMTIGVMSGFAAAHAQSPFEKL